ncbi:MAG: DUF1553 domain-containing protein [Planctomycetes bacterium]|nr:DUF1553 domain-containing protein [Planctomycetota bacterium]
MKRLLCYVALAAGLTVGAGVALAATADPDRPHWSFVTPARPPVPRVTATGWTRNGVDHFVLAKLESAGLRPSPEADRATLIRRVTVDLTGLPPTPAEVDAFLADTSPDAYEEVVDRLLASPRYGEHMARDWLDQARYADTHGYFTDHERFMWRWRDWVINAYNRNMPFDQFTIEQLAGDLLPGATVDQRVATGFNRNHMVTEETGVIPEEYRTEYVADRVRTTAAVWMGLTAGCAQCHDHKYDPVTQREFYQLFAYFNNLSEEGVSGGKKNAAPVLDLASPEEAAWLAELRKRIQELDEKLKGLPTGAANAGSAFETADEQRKEDRKKIEAERDKLREDERRLAARTTVMVMQEMDKSRDTFVLVRGQYDQPGERVQAGVPAFLPSLPPDAPPNRLGLARWLVDPQHPLTARVAVNRLWRQLFGAGIVATVEDFGLQGEPPSHPELLDWLATEFMNPSPQPFPPRGEGAFSFDSPPRGEGVSSYCSHQILEGASSLPSSPRGEGPSPLPSTLGGWDVKHIQRLIVISATYRQSSHVTPAMLQADPRNRLLARAPRHRLDAEVIRDSALFASGLLVENIGGPSVKPYQPPDLWKHITYDRKNTQSYDQSTGEGLYRRSLYTYWKRQVPPPTMQLLDAPTRETCLLRRQRTNTPLQALALLNDVQFVEAARALGQRMMQYEGSDADRVCFGFRLVTSRGPTDRETDQVLRLLAAERTEFRKEPAAADSLLSVGESRVGGDAGRCELAAWTVVGNLLLNLDEAMNRE